MATKWLNKVQIIGTVGRDPEVFSTKSGESVVNMSVATSEAWKGNDGEKQDRTEWHRVVLFKKAADIAAQYVKKGQMVYVEGKLQTRKYEKDGIERYSTEIVCDQFSILRNPDTGGSKQDRPLEAARKPEPKKPAPVFADDDIPF